MSLAVNNLNLYNTNFFAKANELVSGSELEQVTQEIFAAATAIQSSSDIQTSPQIDLSKIRPVDNGLKVFGAESNLDAQTVKQISGFDVTLSQNALSAIESLKVQAAKIQAANIPQKMDGKIYVPAEVADFSDIKSVFSLSNAAQLFETTNLNKDKGNSTPLFTFQGNAKKEDKEQENLNLFI